MKLIKLFISTAVLSLVLSSCGNANNNNNGDMTNTEHPSGSPAATASPDNHESVGEKTGDVANDVVNGVENGVNDVGNTAKNVVDDITK